MMSNLRVSKRYPARGGGLVGGIALAASGLALMCCESSVAQQVAAAGAPSDETGALQEITVTARKRDENLIDTPVAVDFLGADQIQRSAITDLSGLSEEIPQLHISKFGGAGNGASIAIRGIGSPSVDSGVESTVSMVFDGVQLSRGALTSLGLFDLGNIQVLKGPQALFFGKNSPGGVISVNSAAPTDTWQGYVRPAYEFNAEEPTLEGAVGGPITDTLKVRFSAKYSEQRGYLDNTAQGGTYPNPLYPELVTYIPNDPKTFTVLNADERYLPSDRSIFGRIVVDWTPLENFSAALHVLGGQLSNDGEGTAWMGKCASGTIPYEFGLPNASGHCNVGTNLSAVGLPASYAVNLPFGQSNLAPSGKFDGTLDSLELNYEAKEFAVTSVTGFAHYAHNSFDVEDSQFGFFDGGIHESYRQLSEEVRLRSTFESPFNFVTGLLYEDSHEAFQEDVFLGLGLFPADPATGRYDSSVTNTFTHGTTLSPFGQMIWKIRDDLELDAGARWTRETRDNTQYNGYANPYAAFLGLQLLPPSNILSGKQTFTNTSPEVTLTWHPVQEAMVYGAFKTGYKSGGYSSPGVLSGTPATTDADYAFKPEKATGGEVGAKGRFLDGRLQITGAIYDYRFEDLQQSVFNAPTVSFSIKNAASATTKGAESDIAWKALRDLTLRASLSYNHGRFESYSNAPCYSGQPAPGCGPAGTQDLSGTRLPYSSDFIEQVGFTWDRKLISNYRVSVGSNAQYLSSFDTSPTGNPVAAFGPMWMVDANVGIYPDSNSWRVEMTGRNLLDKHFIEVASDRVGAIGPTGASESDVFGPTNRPIELWLQFTKYFGNTR